MTLRGIEKRLLQEGINVDDNSWQDFLTAGEKAGLEVEELEALQRPEISKTGLFKP